jgi:hypothetical protein
MVASRSSDASSCTVTAAQDVDGRGEQRRAGSGAVSKAAARTLEIAGLVEYLNV